MEQAAWVQAIASVFLTVATLVLIAVTAAYVRLTNKILHAPYRAFLKPIDWQYEKPIIVVRNFGPSLAVHVEMKAKVIKPVAPIPTKKDPFRVAFEINSQSAHGSHELEPGYRAEYIFEDLLSSGDPLFLRWKSITGKTQKSAWFIPTHPEKEFVPLSFYSKAKFWLKWGYILVRSPLETIRKRWRLRAAKQNR